MKWGILSTGSVAHAFADALRYTDGELIAVGSRTIQKAKAFSREHGGMFTLEGSLVTLPGVEVVYVASPASEHYRHALMALQAGKHVLVEKAFTVTERQASQLTVEARSRGLFLMEAAWCRFLPSWAKLRDLLAAQAVGEVRAVEASFGGRAVFNPTSRPFRRDLAGGALMDGGVYPIHLAEMVLGAPRSVSAYGVIGLSGVDEQVLVAMDFCGDRVASCLAGIRTTFSGEARIYGTDGMIVLPGSFTNPSWIEVHRPGREPEHYDFDVSRHRLAWQVDEVQRCIGAGAVESALMPHDSSYAVMRVLDKARAEIGLTFGEAEAT